MAFGSGRTNLQAAIEDECSALKSMLHEFKDYFARTINSIRVEKETAIKDEDIEVTSTICRDYDYRESVYLEYEQEFLKMMIVRVFSYAEKILSQLLKSNPKIARNNHKDKSDIEAYFITICNEHGITHDITEVWPNFHEFREKRKNITHNKKDEYFNISYEYIETNISEICTMLLTLESYLR